MTYRSVKPAQARADLTRAVIMPPMNALKCRAGRSYCMSLLAPRSSFCFDRLKTALKCCAGALELIL
jgi:hypothetical protein